jgi:glycosyltransferase involved in cell wall biosynthesis
LRLSGLDARGCIVGSARSNEDLRPELEQQAAALGLLPGALQFLGSVADMGPVYRKANIFVLTSEHEGTPNVLIEAMAAGLPIVATNVGGVPEIVKDGLTGFLLDGQDLQGQIAAIGKLIRDPHLRARIGRQARAHAEENYALDRLPAYLTGLYETAFSRGHTRKGYAASISPGIRTTATRNRFLQHKNEVYEH